MLARLADLLLPRPRAVRLRVAAVPADVLLQSTLVLRGVGAAIARVDLDGGTLEARLAGGPLLSLLAEPDGDGSRITIDADGRGAAAAARLLARELARVDAA